MNPAGKIVAEDLDTLCTVVRSELAKMAGKRVLITGGAGFLGYYLVQTLTHFNRLTAAVGSKVGVTVLDNFSRGAPAWLTSLAEAGEVALQKHDMKHALPSLPEVAFIVHAASIASPTYYRIDPIGTMDANINGLRNLLDYARARGEAGNGVEGMLFFSSSEIYGDPDAANIPTAEDYRGLVSCTGPRACYDEAKRFGETLCVNFARQHGIPVKSARPFNNYGPGLKISDGRLIPDFAGDILAGRDIVMLSDGTPTRTFCYATDAIAGYYKVLVNGRSGEAYNIGTETPEISVADLAGQMIEISRSIFGYRGKLVRGATKDRDYLTDNPNRRCPVIAKARAEIGYAPRVALAEGLRRSLLWYQGHPVAEAR